ncbi:MAG: DUF4197 domain-containing protein [Rhodoferax sp.]
MRRRLVNQFLLAGWAAGLGGPAWAQDLSALSSGQATQGLREALARGARLAVEQLGRPDGFLGNARLRIGLPPLLQDAQGLLRALGQGERLDALVTAMNRAAEAAVPQAQDLLVGAVKSLSVKDAKAILTGGDTSVTQFFADKTRSPLTQKFLPIVTQATERVDLAGRYNQLVDRVSSMGLAQGKAERVENYVTHRALDGLYTVIGEEEKKLRQDPLGSGSAILQKVFGALRR